MTATWELWVVPFSGLECEALCLPLLCDCLSLAHAVFLESMRSASVLVLIHEFVEKSVVEFGQFAWEEGRKFRGLFPTGIAENYSSVA